MHKYVKVTRAVRLKCLKVLDTNYQSNKEYLYVRLNP